MVLALILVFLLFVTPFVVGFMDLHPKSEQYVLHCLTVILGSPFFLMVWVGQMTLAVLVATMEMLSGYGMSLRESLRSKPKS